MGFLRLGAQRELQETSYQCGRRDYQRQKAVRVGGRLCRSIHAREKNAKGGLGRGYAGTGCISKGNRILGAALGLRREKVTFARRKWKAGNPRTDWQMD